MMVNAMRATTPRLRRFLKLVCHLSNTWPQGILQISDEGCLRIGPGGCNRDHNWAAQTENGVISNKKSQHIAMFKF